MANFEERGSEIKKAAKALILEFLHSAKECKPKGDGLKQAQIFKQCGFDWGDYPVATSSNQQYWVAAILWELKKEGEVERVSDSGPWRLASKKTSESEKDVKCEVCGEVCRANIGVNCMCDKDFCNGNRCGANEIIRNHKCYKCGWESKTSSEYLSYMDRHTR